MSNIIKTASPSSVPTDLAKRIGSGGIKEIINVMWAGYHELFNSKIVAITHAEDQITQEWAIIVIRMWSSKNRSSKIRLTPVNQYADKTFAKSSRKLPTIDFCFRADWESDGYFGIECKNLYDKDFAHIKRYYDTGVQHFISGYYGSKSTINAMIGYVLSGKISDIANELNTKITKGSFVSPLVRDLKYSDAHYVSKHTRVCDSKIITLNHLLFNFA